MCSFQIAYPFQDKRYTIFKIIMIMGSVRNENLKKISGPFCL